LPPVVIVEPSADVRAAGNGAGTHEEERDASSVILEGKVQRFGDHVDTDAIIPGEFCHLTSPAEIGRVAFHYVRPDFGERVARGENVLVAGEGWGSGSSREHAVWALKYAGVVAIVAKSYAFIHKRNLVNEAVPFFVVSDPAFYDAADDGAPISIDAATGRITLGGHTYRSDPVSAIAHQIQSAGGIVPAVERHGKDTFDALTAGAVAG
jgi:aconitate hydratase/homoaconitate hydratase